MKKSSSQRGPRHGMAAALAAIAVAAGCSSNTTGSTFGDPASEDAGDDGPASYGIGSSGGGGGGGSSSSGGARSRDGGDGGGDARGPSCHGVPPSCSSRADESACSAIGCTWGGMCTGTALPCAGLNQSKCGIQQNCTYDNVTQQCSGTVYACSVLGAAYGCTTQQGCSWQMGCTGTATVACSALGDSASCAAAGCVWN
jgi:hypothetical protein